MRRLLIVCALGALLVASLGAYGSPAQEPPGDLGNQDLLVIGCDYAASQAAREGLTVRYCRRAAPEEVSGYHAQVHLRVAIAGMRRPFVVNVELYKSLWSPHSFQVRPG